MLLALKIMVLGWLGYWGFGFLGVLCNGDRTAENMNGACSFFVILALLCGVVGGAVVLGVMGYGIFLILAA